MQAVEFHKGRNWDLIASNFTGRSAKSCFNHWIKVVQRLPVRIELDPRELKQHPLQVGLSMCVDIDVSGAK